MRHVTIHSTICFAVRIVCGLSAATTMSSSVPSASAPMLTLDALPYVDAIHEDYEVYALALVEEEMAKISPSTTTTRKLPPLRASVLLQTEYEFVSKGEKMRSPPLELNDVHPPPSDSTVEAWKESIHNARAAYEAERLRSQVLELEEKHAPEQWKRYTNQVLQPLEQDQISLFEHEKSGLEEMHAQRQNEQCHAGETLTQLHQHYHTLIRKRHYLQMATRELEEQVNTMKQKGIDPVD